VIYSSVIFALLAFLTTMGTQGYKQRKEGKEAIARGKELEKEIEKLNNSSADPDPSGNPSQTQPNAQGDAIKSSRTDCCKGEDWLVGMVI
jgi:hypothetical protein